MLTDWKFNTYQHFSQVNMQKCGNDKKNYHKCHLNGYNIEFYKKKKKVYSISAVYIQSHPITLFDIRVKKTYQAYLTHPPSEEPELAFEATEVYC